MIVIEIQQCLKPSLQLPQSRLNSSSNFPSVTFGPQNIQFREKCDPIVDRISLTASKSVTHLSESTPINANWAAMTPNSWIFASNRFNSSHHCRLCLKWSRIHRRSVRIHRKSTRIVSYVSKPPQPRRKSSQIALEAFKLPPNRLRIVAKKLMTRPFCK